MIARVRGGAGGYVGADVGGAICPSTDENTVVWIVYGVDVLGPEEE